MLARMLELLVTALIVLVAVSALVIATRAYYLSSRDVPIMYEDEDETMQFEQHPEHSHRHSSWS